MKIILTGAAGFIGSCFASHLNTLGITDLIVVDTPSSADGIANLAGKKISDYWSREQLLRRLDDGVLPDDIDGFVHLGACADTTEMDRGFLAKNNVEYSKRLTRWCLSKNKFFHYASSASVYGDGQRGYRDDDGALTQFQPLNPYAESKWLFDKWLIEENLTNRVTGYRYFNVFGPNEKHKGDMRSMVCKAFEQIMQTGKARLFANSRSGFSDGSEERDFIYVKDVCHVMQYFLEHRDKGGIFNVGTGQARSFKDLVSAVFSALGRRPDIEYFPMPEKLKKQYQYFTQADIGKLRAAGYHQKFTPLEDAVRDYVQQHLSPNHPL